MRLQHDEDARALRERPTRGLLDKGPDVAPFFYMERIRAGRAYCALCGNAIRPDEDALLTPDFIADDADPLWRFADAAMHRACFLVWDRRKAFVTRYNRLARRWVASDGTGWRMTSEGDIVRRATP